MISTERNKVAFADNFGISVDFLKNDGWNDYSIGTSIRSVFTSVDRLCQEITVHSYFSDKWSVQRADVNVHKRYLKTYRCFQTDKSGTAPAPATKVYDPEGHGAHT